MFRIESVLWIGLALPVLGIACGDEPTALEQDAEEQICELLSSGPYLEVTSSTTSSTAPDATRERTAVNVRLTDGRGVISYEIGAFGDYTIGLDADVPVIVTQRGADRRIVDSQKSTVHCEHAKALYTFELIVGTAFIEIGPSTADVVSMVVAEKEIFAVDVQE